MSATSNKQFQEHIFGGDLRRMRLTAQKTTSIMAESAGIASRKTYENWESDKSAPNINQYLSMLSECGYDVQPFIDITRLPPEVANQVLSSMQTNIGIMFARFANAHVRSNGNILQFQRFERLVKPTEQKKKSNS
jgi:DNA-binding XRE family transcriptional regulator